MNNLAVFCFYNAKGIVHDYAFYLVNSLRDVAKDIVIIVNGEINDSGLKKLQEITHKVYKRENYGFDGGAYKKFFLEYAREFSIDSYDNIILLNDTFFGPFIPWNKVFDIMHDTGADFWGLSSHKAKGEIGDHIQGYFLVVGRKIVVSRDILKFFGQMKMPVDYDSAVKNFEVAFTPFFEQLGYRYATYEDVVCKADYINEEGTIYINHAGDLIQDCHFPVLKKKIINNVAYYMHDVEQWLLAYRCIPLLENRYPVKCLDEYMQELLSIGNYNKRKDVWHEIACILRDGLRLARVCCKYWFFNAGNGRTNSLAVRKLVRMKIKSMQIFARIID